MKHLKIGALAIIALAAMSFTLVSRHTNLKKFAIADGCYTSINVAGLPSKTSPPTNPPYTTASKDVSAATNPPSILLTSTTDLDALKAGPCSGASAFCCFRVVNNQITHVVFKNPPGN